VAQLRAVDQQISGYRQLEKMLSFYCRTPLLPFDEKAVEVFQRIWLTRPRIGTMDLKIAAIALANDATLLSRFLRPGRRQGQDDRQRLRAIRRAFQGSHVPRGSLFIAV